MESNPLDPVASEPLSHAGQVFTSDLSINEFALLHGAGFEPIELVMGVSVYHVGYQFTGIRQQSELAVLTDATYRRPRTRRAPSSQPMTRHTTSGLATVVKLSSNNQQRCLHNDGSASELCAPEEIRTPNLLIRRHGRVA
jgi:uncharacterized protein YbjQ (UPF0145 family)